MDLRDTRLLAAMMNGKTSIADELVFPSHVGTVLKPDNIAPRYMQPALEKAGLGHFRFHDLETFIRLAADPGRRISRLRKGTDGSQLNSNHRGRARASDSRSRHRMGGPTGLDLKSATIRNKTATAVERAWAGELATT